MGMLPQGRGACQRANRSPLHVGGRDERALPGPYVRVPRAGLHGERPQGGIPIAPCDSVTALLSQDRF